MACGPFSVFAFFLQYFSLDDLVVDVELLSSNACTFNENDSQVYKVC